MLSQCRDLRLKLLNALAISGVLGASALRVHPAEKPIGLGYSERVELDSDYCRRQKNEAPGCILSRMEDMSEIRFSRANS
jgi:hypothetical protein